MKAVTSGHTVIMSGFSDPCPVPFPSTFSLLTPRGRSNQVSALALAPPTHRGCTSGQQSTGCALQLWPMNTFQDAKSQGPGVEGKEQPPACSVMSD